MKRLTDRASGPATATSAGARRSSLFAKVVAAIIAAVLLSAGVAAVVVGLLTFTIVLVLLVPIVFLLLVYAIVAGRAKVNVHMRRRDGAGVPQPPSRSSNGR